MVLSLIAIVFLIILLVFNLLVREYIKSSVNEQLQSVIQTVYYGRHSIQSFPPEGQPVSPESRLDFFPEIRRLPRGPVGEAEAMIISEHYELIFPDQNLIFLKNYDEINALAAQLKSEQAALDSNEIMHSKVSGTEYYFVSVKAPADMLGSGTYLIYYIDMTAIASFAERINKVLLAVMGLAGILASASAIFLSGVIAKPVRELTQFAVRIGKGDFAKSVFNFKDLELAELAESMNKAAAQLDAYDKEQKIFFQNVSHELRTPLQAVRCNAEGIEHGILDHKNASRVIISETDRLNEMVEELLYISRIDTISQRSRLVECDLRELLSNCAEGQKSLALERGIHFVFEFDKRPVYFCCEEKSISRAFSNLISNAIRYAERKIILSCRKTKEGIVIMVIDDGAGIASEDLPHIFDRFYKGKEGKHGIGLSIVKSIVEQHQGRIKVKSTPAGAAFRIVF